MTETAPAPVDTLTATPWTVLGFWHNDTPVSVGVVQGNLEVYGGSDSPTGGWNDGSYQGTWTIGITHSDPVEAERRAVEEMTLRSSLHIVLDDVGPYQLELDDPQWSYAVDGQPRITRRMRVWRVTHPSDNFLPELVAVITEDGPGMSVTNAAHQVLQQLQKQYPGLSIRLIEHYPAGVGIDPIEHYDEVTAHSIGQGSWRRLDPDLLSAELPGLLGTTA